MNVTELLMKAERGETLTAAEHAQLDSLLGEQSEIQSAVMASQVDDSPSLQWRSELNQKLMETQPAPLRKRFQLWHALPLIGAAAAMATFFIIPTQPNTSTPQTVAIEQELLNVHDQLMNSSDMNLAKSDSVSAPKAVDAEVLEWSQGNSDSL